MLNGHALRVARYRFRSTFARRWAAYVTLVLLIGLLGGLAMGSVAAARRTQSSFPEYIAADEPFQLTGVSAEFIPGYFKAGYNPGVISKIAHLDHVAAVGNVVGLVGGPISPNGTLQNPELSSSMTFVGTFRSSYGAEGAGVSLISGRLPAATALHAFIADKAAVARLHLHLGATVTFGFFTNADTQLPDFGSAKVQPVYRVTAKLAGIITTPQSVVEDDVDASTGDAIFSPAVTSHLLQCCTDFTQTDIEVRGNSATIAKVGAAALQLVPRGAPPFTNVATTTAKAERAIKPESIALGAFGAIVALTALLIASQLIGRQLRLGIAESNTMRALGADPMMTAADGLLGILGAVLLGTLLAAGVAIALSPLSPLGPVRPFYPTPGVAFDWTVLGAGIALLLLVLGAIAIALSHRYAPREIARRAARLPGDPSPLLSAISNGLPAPALVGVRFAIEPGRGVDPVPVRSVIFASVLALIVVMSSVVFGASLNSLVAHPSLYGWNWNYELDSEFGAGNIPATKADSLLADDHDVASWSGTYFATVEINGETVPVLGQQPGAVVGPPTLTGHGLSGPDEIVLGAVTLADLHKQLGDIVTVTAPIPGSDHALTTKLHIVGTATMPTIGQGTSTHLEMGTGAVIPTAAIPAPLRDPPTNATPGGPDAIFLRLRPGVTPAAALPALQRIAASLANVNNDGVVVHSVERPAEIVNYKTLGATPTILGAALAAGTIIGLGLTLVASVRRRRRDLALLKTLGFTKPQLGAVVACQATVAVTLGLLLGVPLGIVAGRYLWDLFANSIHAVPSPTVSALAVVLIALGALVLANLVSLFPGRVAARTSIGTLLRTD